MTGTVSVELLVLGVLVVVAGSVVAPTPRTRKNIGTDTSSKPSAPTFTSPSDSHVLVHGPAKDDAHSTVAVLPASRLAATNRPLCWNATISTGAEVAAGSTWAYVAVGMTSLVANHTPPIKPIRRMREFI